MATDSAPGSSVTAPRRLTLRDLWQVPTFFLGVSALLIVGFARPTWRDNPARNLERDIRTVRRALQDQPPDVNKVLTLGNSLLEQVTRIPAREGEVRYLLGSAHLLQAAGTSGTAQAESLQQARELLEVASSLGVPDADRNTLNFRTGKLWFLIGTDPRKTIDFLTKVTDENTNERADKYGMLAQSYLSLKPPDRQAALEANEKQLEQASDHDDQVAAARLLRGELLLEDRQPEEARKVLARVPSTAPADVYLKARTLRARICQQANLWQEAAPLWKALLDDALHPLPDRGRVLYDLGQCYLGLNRPADAAKAWEQALQQEGDGATAARFRLAQMNLNDGKKPLALQQFEQALRAVTESGGYRNALVSVDEARRLIEDNCRACRDGGDFDTAQKLAGLYGKVAVKGADRELFAQTSEAWAQACLAQAAAAKDSDTVKRLDESARIHNLEAGLAYEDLVNLAGNKADETKWLWVGAERFARSNEPIRAVSLLSRFLKIESTPLRQSEGWLRMGHVQRDLKDVAAAKAAYLNCIDYAARSKEYAGSFALWAHYQLALFDMDEGKLDDAEAQLKQILELWYDPKAGQPQSPDRKVHEATFFTLAELLYQRRNYRMAYLRFHEALERYPQNANALTARFHLADCYRQLAAAEKEFLSKDGGGLMTDDGKKHHEMQYRLWLERAVVNYQKLVDDLAARQSAGGLKPDEETILYQAEFYLAECRFDRGDFAGALRYYELLVDRYHGKTQSLTMLQKIWRCQGLLGQREQARATVERVRAALREFDQLPSDQQLSPPVRREWERWLNFAATIPDRPGG